MLWTLVYPWCSMASKAGRGRRICAELSYPQVPVSAWGGRGDVMWHSRAVSVPLAGEGQLAAGRDINTGHGDPPLSSRRV